MKKLLLILLCLPMIGFGQITLIPDANFEQRLISFGYDNILDGTVLTAAIDTVTQLEVSYYGISDLTGIEDFTDLTELGCAYNGLTSLDVSQNTALSFLILTGNQLTSLDVSQNTDLTQLWCDDNQLISLDVSQNTALTKLECQYNQLTSLDLSQNTSLNDLQCNDNQITSLDISQNTALTELECYDNQLTSLDISQDTALIDLDCRYNQLTSLDVSANTALINLECEENQLTSLDVSNNTTLTELRCQLNLLTCLDISTNTNLNYLDCSDNLLEQLNTKNGFWASGMDIYAKNNNLTCVEVDNLGYANTNWASEFDSFIAFSTNCNYTNPCNTSTSIQEQSTNKELLKVIDLLGRETKQTNQPLLYIYDDGTVEKRIVIE